MAEDDRSYAKTYAAMTDEEILALVHDSGAFADEAQVAIKAEAIPRGLDTTAPKESSTGARKSGRAVVRSVRKLLDRWLISLSPNVGPPDDIPATPSIGRLESSIRNSAAPLPIGGWLLVLIIYMLLVPAIEWAWLLTWQLKYVKESDRLLGSLLFARILLSVPALLFMMLASMTLITRLRKCVEIAKISLTVEMIVAFVFAVVFVVYFAFENPLLSMLRLPSVLSQPTQSHFSVYLRVVVEFLHSLLPGFYAALPNLIGLLYLQKSRRVRLTYPSA